ncbi:MAG: polyprenyl synthetase family protein [Firmicutes bacterium]|nr:polyprenyl synthetase family protein [Bacillota bacterium]
MPKVAAWETEAQDPTGALQAGLQAVEARLASQVESTSGPIKQSARLLLEAGGKRLRPTLVLLAAQFGDPDRRAVEDVAAAIELLHMATLLHDDVVDDAPVRRGAPTARSHWGDQVAMSAGDFLFGRALSLLADLPYPQLHLRLARTIVAISTGELEQLRDLWRTQQGLLRYLRRTRRKTALLIQSACELGAIVAEVPAPQQALLAQYGYALGMAFQITDDLIDMLGATEEAGKPVGNDLRQGNLTLPVLYALWQQPNGWLARAIGARVEIPIADAVKEIDQLGGFAYTLRVALRYQQEAVAAAEALPTGVWQQMLRRIAQDVVGRRQ